MLWFSFTLVQVPHGGILHAFQQIKVNKGNSRLLRNFYVLKPVNVTRVDKIEAMYV